MTTDLDVCYRHPGEETRVHCTRCGRPICPECMTPAPVGHHCPECVAEGTRDMRARRMTFRRPTSATTVLLVLNAAVFVADLLLRRRLVQLGAMNPILVAGGEYWRLLSAMFLHASVTHLLLNLVGLYIFGNVIEGVFGTGRFVAIYLVTGFVASATSFAFGHPLTFAVGASGAIFGLLGSWLAYNVRRRSLSLARSNIQGALILIAINLFLGFAIPNIDNLAHLGGLASGFAAGFAVEGLGAGSARRWSQVAGLLGLVGAGIALAAWRAADLASLGPLA